MGSNPTPSVIFSIYLNRKKLFEHSPILQFLSCRILQDFAGLIERESYFMKVEELLKRPESKTLEFKRDISSLGPILKTVIAFANTAGGTLVIGISPNGELLGVKDIFQTEEKIANSIADNIRPQILPDIEISTVKGKDLLVIKVAHWRAPFYLKKEGFPNGVYIRLGTTSRPAGTELLRELQRSVLTASFDQQPVNDTDKHDLNRAQIIKSFELVDKKINEQKLRSMGVLVPLGQKLVPSIGGLILFGKKQLRKIMFPESRVSCARFLGNTKTDILDQYEVEGTLVDAVEEVPKFIARNTRQMAEIKEIRRKNIPEYSPIAIREALINALAHADYSLSGSHIQIAIFDDRLEIQNPGMFPFGFTFEDLKSGVSRIRNKAIVRVFHELQLMEEWGSGYKRIIESCEKGGYPDPKWEELGTNIRVTFYPFSQALLEIKKEKKKRELTLREKTILALFKNKKSLSFREIFNNISPKVSERMLRYDLAQLKIKEFLRPIGRGRATIWKKI